MIRIQILSENDMDISPLLIEFAEFIGLEQIAHERYSSLFILQLFQAYKNRELNPARVIREINSLENTPIISHTKKEIIFKGQFLNGLWHKHFQESGLRSMAINLRKGLDKYGIPWLEKQIKENEKNYEVKYITPNDIDQIVNDIVIGHWKRLHDEQIMTGEWIIFSKHNELNYYLSLGSHRTDDSVIRKMIDDWCIPEFSFLSEILQPIQKS